MFFYHVRLWHMVMPYHLVIVQRFITIEQSVTPQTMLHIPFSRLWRLVVVVAVVCVRCNTSGLGI